MSDLSLRRVALRLAALSREDSDWILAQLSPSEALSLRGLLNELQQQGLAQDAAVLDAVLVEPARSSARDSEERIARQLEALRKPAWRALLVQSLDGDQRQQWQSTLLADNPFVYRQIFAESALANLPPAWSDALSEYASGPSLRQ